MRPFSTWLCRFNMIERPRVRLGNKQFDKQTRLKDDIRHLSVKHEQNSKAPHTHTTQSYTHIHYLCLRLRLLDFQRIMCNNVHSTTRFSPNYFETKLLIYRSQILVGPPILSFRRSCRRRRKRQCLLWLYTGVYGCVCTKRRQIYAKEKQINSHYATYSEQEREREGIER